MDAAVSFDAERPFARIGTALKVSRNVETDLSVAILVSIQNKRTGASKVLELPPGIAGATFSLSPETLPDLPADRSKVERYSVRATYRAENVETEIAIYQDLDAKLPPLTALRRLAGLGPMPGGTPVPGPAPAAGVMERRAIAVIADWNPATYSLSVDRLLGKDLPSRIMGLDESWFRQYTAIGSFGKYVVPAFLSGMSEALIAEPTAVVIYIPEVGEAPVAYQEVRL